MTIISTKQNASTHEMKVNKRNRMKMVASFTGLMATMNMFFTAHLFKAGSNPGDTIHTISCHWLHLSFWRLLLVSLSPSVFPFIAVTYFSVVSLLCLLIPLCGVCVRVCVLLEFNGTPHVGVKAPLPPTVAGVQLRFVLACLTIWETLLWWLNYRPSGTVTQMNSQKSQMLSFTAVFSNETTWSQHIMLTSFDLENYYTFILCWLSFCGSFCFVQLNLQ